jgi:excisionase family DNA binding protein
MGGIEMVRREETQTRPRERREMAEAENGTDLLTVHEVARHLRVDDTTVRRWIKSGALDAITLPHRGKRQGYRVRKKTIDDLFNTSTLPM